MKAISVLVLVCVLAGIAHADNHRSRSEVRAFRAENPCPATGKKRGACPGYEVDHVIPLCDGGQDKVSNMQWLTVQAHREKTKRDIKTCRKK